VAPAGRTDAGYRLYDEASVGRLELVRTLRALDVDLPTTRRVLAREVTLAEVAATHAAALDGQIRVLRLPPRCARGGCQAPRQPRGDEAHARLELLATINGWPQRPSGSPAWGWLLGALRVD
jgi:DNA-binding transcriptional MerR regulator